MSRKTTGSDQPQLPLDFSGRPLVVVTTPKRMGIVEEPRLRSQDKTEEPLDERLLRLLRADSGAAATQFLNVINNKGRDR